MAMFKPTRKILPDDSPPDSGEIRIVLPIAPVSLQASRKHKDVVHSAIRKVTKTAKYIITGDVSVDIEWLVHEHHRYETDKSPDVDNILKPILDALCGKDGLLLDDCQVQSVACRWIDWTRDDQQITISIQCFPDDWLQKKPLVFVHLGKGLCMPVYSDMPSEAMKMFLDRFDSMLETRDKLYDLTGDYGTSQLVMSVQRVFHRSRLGDFKVIEEADLRKQITSHKKKANKSVNPSGG